MSKSEFLIVPKGTKFAGSGKLGFKGSLCRSYTIVIHSSYIIKVLKPSSNKKREKIKTNKNKTKTEQSSELNQSVKFQSVGFNIVRQPNPVFDRIVIKRSRTWVLNLEIEIAYRGVLFPIYLSL